jgi:hypothetical protein
MQNQIKLIMVLSLLILFVQAPVLSAADATLVTDKQDYEPGETVNFTGTGFLAGEDVNLTAAGATNGTQIFIQTTAGDTGEISGSFELPAMFEATYTLTAKGVNSGIEVSAAFYDSVGQFAIDSPPSPVNCYPGDANVLTVFAKSTGGGAPPAEGVPVVWTTTDAGGTLTSPNPLNGKTGADGKASITYTAGSTPGIYTVTATAPGAGGGGQDKRVSWDVNIKTPAAPIDINAPVTSITLNPLTPNGANGWYITNVDVTLTSTDNGGSGVKEIHYAINGNEMVVSAAIAMFSITSEGTNTLDYWAVDNATPANVEDTNTATIKIDKTKPEVTITAPANGAYYRTNNPPGLAYTIVELNPSGLPVVTGWSTEEGEHTVTVTVTDEAGNVGSASVTYYVDNTPPITNIILSGLEGNNGWYRSDVDVNLTASDNLSGVKEIHYILNGGSEKVIEGNTTSFTISTEAINSLVCWAVDNVENEETHHNQDIKIDKTAPTITASQNPAANSFGWNNTDVTVSFETYDALSGIDPDTDPNDVVLSLEGAGQSASGTVYDMAGNSASTTISNINIDKTSPVVTITVPAENTSYLLNQSINAEWTAEDALSGIDSANTSGTVPSGSPLPTGTPGTNTFSVTATDKAGNVTTVTRTYGVEYDFIGFFLPVDNPPVVNVGKAGRTFPIKWQLKDANGKFISDLSVVLYNPPRYGETAGESSIWNEPLPGDTSGSSGLRYDSSSNQFIFTWQTSKTFANKSYVFKIELNDGSVHELLFKFTK